MGLNVLNTNLIEPGIRKKSFLSIAPLLELAGNVLYRIYFFFCNNTS
jgi:hypothetical protein